MPRGRTGPFAVFIMGRPPRSSYVSNCDRSFATWSDAPVSYSHLFRPELEVTGKTGFPGDREVIK